MYFTPDEFRPVAPAGAQNAPGEIGDCEAVGHFFLYPVGHFGETAATFLINLPLTQVIVTFLGDEVIGLLACAVAVGVTSGAFGSTVGVTSGAFGSTFGVGVGVTV